MSDPITADQLLKQLDLWQVPFKEIPGWRTRGRDTPTGKPFGPVYGAVQHHTGDDAADLKDLQVCIDGRAGLPGPLVQFGANDNGVIDLISIHRSNHAGGGDPAVLSAVINESYGKYPPPTHFHEGSPGQADGNDCFYGCEAYYSGSHRMTPVQYKSVVMLWAAIFDFHKWTGKSLIGHKEWSNWKPDPGSTDMHQLRLDVDAALKAGPPSRHKPAPHTRTTHFGELLDAAIAEGEKIPLDRRVVHDVLENVKLQRARLPKS